MEVNGQMAESSSGIESTHGGVNAQKSAPPTVTVIHATAPQEQTKPVRAAIIKFNIPV